MASNSTPSKEQLLLMLSETISLLEQKEVQIQQLQEALKTESKNNITHLATIAKLGENFDRVNAQNYTYWTGKHISTSNPY
jgi:hypothetical protein